MTFRKSKQPTASTTSKYAKCIRIGDGKKVQCHGLFMEMVISKVGGYNIFNIYIYDIRCYPYQYVRSTHDQKLKFIFKLPYNVTNEDNWLSNSE